MTSCYTLTYSVGEGAKTGIEVKEKNHYLIYGLAPVKISDPTKMAGDAKDYTVTIQHTFVDGLLNACQTSARACAEAGYPGPHLPRGTLPACFAPRPGASGPSILVRGHTQRRSRPLWSPPSPTRTNDFGLSIKRLITPEKEAEPSHPEA